MKDARASYAALRQAAYQPTTLRLRDGTILERHPDLLLMSRETWSAARSVTTWADDFRQTEIGNGRVKFRAFGIEVAFSDGLAPGVVRRFFDAG